MVSPIDRYPGQANVLMLKKAMETQKLQFSIVEETLAKQQEVAAKTQGSLTPHLGGRIDLRM